jgi:hypothetical protein
LSGLRMGICLTHKLTTQMGKHYGRIHAYFQTHGWRQGSLARTNSNLDETNMDWIGGIAAQNKYVGGNGLPFDDARVVMTQNGKPVVTNGAFGDIKETLGGYIIVKATSVDEAVSFAKGAPVLQGEGNSVEVRKIARGDGTH